MHRVVTREQWIAERRQLMTDEKELTRRRDALSEKRRALPWVKVDKRYEFDSPGGRVPFVDLFCGRSQLFVQHVMQGPDQPLQCVGCALGVDHLEGLLPHLENHDVSVVAIARATSPELESLRTRMGWRTPFYSSFGSDFNYDYGVSFKPEDLAARRAFYNYTYCDPGIEDISGNSVFFKDEAGDIFHTYSVYARGGEDFLGIYRILEVMPKGRDENGPHQSLTDWVRPHNMYGKGGEVAPTGRYTPPVSCCM
jgi:predicted dithiol-disulfide oxidoreductase (DUF899 family)